MKKAVQRVAAQASMSNQPQELRNLASPAAPSSGVKTQVKAANSESVSDTAVAQPQKFSHMSFQSSDSGGKLGVPFVINPFGCLGKPADMTVAMSRNDEAATSHVLSNGTGLPEKGAKSASAINGQKKLESDDASLSKPSENYIGSEEKRKHAPLASFTAKTAPQPPVRPAATELAATTLADLMNAGMVGSEEFAQDAENADAVQESELEEGEVQESEIRESELEEGEVLESEVQGTRIGANAAPADTPANSQAKTQAMLTEMTSGLVPGSSGEPRVA
jgi:hypothetical protein